MYYTLPQKWVRPFRGYECDSWCLAKSKTTLVEHPLISGQTESAPKWPKYNPFPPHHCWSQHGPEGSRQALLTDHHFTTVTAHLWAAGGVKWNSMLKKWPSADHVECTNNPNNPTIIFPRWGKVNLPNVRKLLSGQEKKFSIYPTLLIQTVSLSNLIKLFHLIYKNKMTELEHHHFDISNKLIYLSFRQKWLLI